MLLLAGRPEEARSVAAELLAAGDASAPGLVADPRPTAGEAVLAMVEASEGRFAAGLERLERALFGLPAFGRLGAGELYLLTLGLELAWVLGRAHEMADSFVGAFVDPDPPRLYPGRYMPGRVAYACSLASPPVARRCFSRLRGLLTARFFREVATADTAAFMKGAEAYASGDDEAATAAWRPLVGIAGLHERNVLAEAFDRAGEHDLAERVDATAISHAGFLHGVGLAHLRAARRAIARGDRARAEQLGRRVLDAWSVADATIPAVAELRSLLAGSARPRPARPR
jgi:hypothetical protein